MFPISPFASPCAPLLQLLLTLLLLPACLRYLERLWGALETLKFISIILIISNASALAVSWLEWAITDNRLFMYVLPTYAWSLPNSQQQISHELPRSDGTPDCRSRRIYPTHP